MNEDRFAFHVVGPFNLKFTDVDAMNIFDTYPLLRNKLFFHGALYGVEKNKILSSSDILVHPTFNDALPVVILEAMSCGICVVSNQEGGIPDLIDDGVDGFLVDENKTDEYVGVLDYLLMNPVEMKVVGGLAKSKYEKNFNVPRKLVF
jgi:glycosyltransferase involved in cell wall biosynthesis